MRILIPFLAALSLWGQVGMFRVQRRGAAAGGSWTAVVQHVAKVCATTTCTLGVGDGLATTGAGHTLVLVHNTYNGADGCLKYVSASGDGSWTYLPSASQCMKDSGNRYATQIVSWIPASTGGATSVTMSVTGTTQAWARTSLELIEVSYTGGTPTFDAGGTFWRANDWIGDPTCTTCAGVDLSLSGTKDIVMQSAVGLDNITAVAGGAFGSPAVNDGHVLLTDTIWDRASLSALNTTNGAAPSWTVASTIPTAVNGAAFGFGASSCSDIGLIDWAGGANGDAFSVTRLKNSTWQSDGGIQWYSVNTSPTFSNTVYQGMVSSFRSCAGGRTGTGGTMVMDYPTSLGANALTTMRPVADSGEASWLARGTNNWSAGEWFYTTIPDNDATTAYSANCIVSNPDYVCTTLIGTGSGLWLECEIYGIARIGTAAIQSGHWYWITREYNTDSNRRSCAVYDTAGSQLGSTSTHAGATSNKPAFFSLGPTGDLVTSGYHIYFGPVKLDTTGSFPLLP